MEPMLELVDRITAHVWLFERRCPVDSWSLLDAKNVLLSVASTEYATLQELSDLYDPQGQTGDAGDPFAWVDAEQSQASFASRVAAWAKVTLWQKPVWERTQEEQHEYRYQIAAYLLDALERRITLLEGLWSRDKGPNSLDAGGSFRQFCKADSSDLMFSKLATWILSDTLSLEDRIRLARTFFPSPLPGQSRKRFLIEGALDMQAEAVLNTQHSR